jgi:hypothetical protein
MNEKETIAVENQDENLEEQTAAAKSLKPSNTTKSELLSQMMKYFAGMKKEDLSSFLDKTLAQVGKEADTVPDTSGANKASVATTHPGAVGPSNVSAYASRSAMKEDMDEFFGEEDLSEEFKTKATTIFEAAVANRVAVEVARIEEEFESSLEEEVTKSVDELHEQVEKYIDYIAEKWLEENKVAIETGIRIEATENFIEGLKNLFKESYIEVPEEKVNMIGEMQQAIEQLQTQLESVQAENIELNKVVNEAMAAATFDEVSEGLADTQIEKLRTLSEGIEYSTAEEYEEKLTIIKEQYFSDNKDTTQNRSGLINEEASIGSNETAESDIVIPEDMKHYFSAISKTVRK